MKTYWILQMQEGQADQVHQEALNDLFFKN